jgi:hypothetical protein
MQYKVSQLKYYSFDAAHINEDGAPFFFIGIQIGKDFGGKYFRVNNFSN